MENNNDKIVITLNIIDAPVKPKIFREEEEFYRSAEKEIKLLYAKYQEFTPDINTILRALALQFAVGKVKKTREVENILGTLEEINLDLEEFLENE